MDTQELVTTIKEDYAPDWSRSKILGYLDRGQKRMFNQDTPQSIFFNSSDDTFPIPILSTTAGTLEYAVSAANLVDSDGAAVTLTKNGYAITPRRVRSVFIQVSVSNQSDYDNLFYGDRFEWAGLNDNWSKKLYRVSFYKVPIIARDRSENEACKVQFVEDPGTEASKYYVEFYYGAISLSAETVPLTIDGDRWCDALIDYVVGQIEMSHYGKSERMDRFERYWMKRFRSSQNAGVEERKPSTMPVRECG